MIFDCQIEPLNELSNLAKTQRQSVLIEGPSGSGKSYLAQQYTNMLSISDMITVAPKVADIRDALDNCIQIQTKVMLLIENLDLGVAAASYTLLKSLEEPLPNVYIVITVRNIKMIPDTIVSRSAVVSANVPTIKDINAYGKMRDELKYQAVKDRLVWRCARSFKDADSVLAMKPDYIVYYESLSELCKFTSNVSDLVWSISHYQDNQPCDIELSIRAVMEIMHNSFITKCGIECLRDLSANRIAQHAILSKFMFNAKYCE